MFRQLLRRQFKLLRGAFFSLFPVASTTYDAGAFWDRFYSHGVSDRQTINPDRDPLSARHHYASVEMLLLRHFHNHGVSIGGRDVLDVGSGAGHWIDFYLSLGAGSVTGVDLSEASVHHLRERYAGNPAVTVHHGAIQGVLAAHPDRYDLANAIGVMFHIVDDGEWRDALRCIAERLRPGGLLLVGGHFPLVGNLNVQVNRDFLVTKRLRSRWRWSCELRRLGFRDVRVYRNHTYLHIKATQPENSVLVAVKQ